MKFLTNLTDIRFRPIVDVSAFGILVTLLAITIPFSSILLDIGLTLFVACVLVVFIFALLASNSHYLPSYLYYMSIFSFCLNISTTMAIFANTNKKTEEISIILDTFWKFVQGYGYVTGWTLLTLLVLINIYFSMKSRKKSNLYTQLVTDYFLNALHQKTNNELNDTLALVETFHRKHLLYGSLDGAIIFINRTVIAGSIIIFINIVGGLYISNISLAMADSLLFSALTFVILLSIFKFIKNYKKNDISCYM